MRQGERGPRPNHAGGNDGRETEVLTCDDPPRWHAPGKEKSEEKSVIDVRGGERCHAGGQHLYIVSHGQLTVRERC